MEELRVVGDASSSRLGWSNGWSDLSSGGSIVGPSGPRLGRLLVSVVLGWSSVGLSDPGVGQLFGLSFPGVSQFLSKWS